MASTSNRKSEVLIVCNTQQAQEQLKQMKDRAKAVRTEMSQLAQAGQTLSARYLELDREMKNLSKSISYNESNMDRMKRVLNDLANSSLRQVMQAARDAKKAMLGMSENDSRLAEMQQNYQKLINQAKILRGEAENIRAGMRQLSQQTDAWLSNAISKQQQLVDVEHKNTIEYQEQYALLKRLQAEQSKRQAAATTKAGETALKRNVGNMNEQQLNQTRQDLTAYRSLLLPGESAKIKEINAQIAQIDANMEKIHGQGVKIDGDLKAIEDAARRLPTEISKMNFSKASPDQLKAKLDEVNRVLNQLGSKSLLRGPLVQQANRLKTALDGVDKEGVDIQKVLENLKSTPLKDLQAAADKLEKEMKEVSRNTQEFANKRAELQKVKREIDNTTNSVKKQEGAWKKTFTAVTSYMGVTMLIGKIQQMLTNVIKLNLKFSDQLADIRKVAQLSIRSINDLSTRLAKLDTRTTIEELNQIAYAGAKLGIGKYGISGLESFVKASNQINVALKEDLGNDALTSLSKLAEVMNLIPKMGVEKSMTAIGSSLFQLSATSTATAGNIVEFSKRLTGLAKVTGVTTDQLLGLASASDAMYLMPEVSATAFNKLFTSIQTKHNLIEQELAVEPGTINNLFTAGKAMDAMVLIFEKMKEKGNMNALQSVFKDLGSDGARLVNVMVTMSQNVDMLKDHLYVSKEAFEEATAVSKEYKIQQETAQALMERASNVWEKSFVNPEGVDNVKSMAKAWYDLSNELTKNQLWMVGMNFALGAIVTSVKTLLFLLPSLLAGLMFKGVVGGGMAVVGMLRTMNDGLTVSTLKTNGLVAAWRTLNMVQKVNAIAAGISAFLTLVTVVASLIGKIKSATTCMEGFDSSTKGVRASIAMAKDEVERYKEAIDKSKKGTNEHAAAIKNFNNKFGQYYKHMLTEKSTANEIARAYERVNKALERKAILELKEKDIAQYYAPAVGWAVEKLYDYDQISKGSKKGSQYNGKWLKGVMDDSNDLQTAVQTLATKLGVSADIVDRAMQSRSQTDIPEQIVTESSNKSTCLGTAYTVDSMRNLTPEERMVYAAARYGSQVFSNRNRKAKIDKKYAPFEKDLKEEPIEPESPGTLTNNAPDKDAINPTEENLRQAKEQKQRDLREAEQEALAIVDNVRNYYERQRTEILKMANETDLGKAATDALLRTLSEHENSALEQLRYALYAAENEWYNYADQVKDGVRIDGKLRDDLREMSEIITLANGTKLDINRSEELLGLISGVDINALRNKINSLEADLHVNRGSTVAAIYRKGSENAGKNETAKMKRREAAKKAQLEDDYVGTVNNQYSERFTTDGYFMYSEVQQKMLQSVAQTSPEVANQFEKDYKKAIGNVFTNVQAHILDIYAIGDKAMKTEEGKNRLMSILLGPQWQTAPTLLTELRDTELENMQGFYIELLKYYDDYVEAEKKKHDRKEKLANFQWEASPEYTAQQKQATDIDIASKGVSQYLSPERPDAEKMPYKDQYGTKLFMSSMGADPEVEAYRLKIEAAREYYNFIEAHGADAQTLREQEQKILEAQIAYAQQVASQIKQRISDVYALAAPVEDFGTSIGAAFATMTEDAEEGRKAMRKAIGDMINGFMKQTVEMTKEYMKRRIMQKMNDRLVQVQMKKQAKVETGLEDKKQDQLLETQELGGKAKEMLTKEVGGKVRDATQQIGQETLQMQQTQTQQEVQTESAKTQANTTMGIASGASKIIGSLGWWGIPLIAVITALLNGLLSFAMSKVSSLFGGGKDSGGDSGPSTKLVSGMLTYDSGNVQAFRGIEDGKTYPVVGSDGKVYAAKDGGELSTGLVEDPITTLVNGQPALVAEKGPEMIIGRETTAAMMMARPDILAEIVKFDRQRSGRTYRAYDAGNVADFAAVAADPVGGPDLERLNATMDALAIVLTKIQQNGIRAHLNKFGRGGLVNEAENGRNFMQHNSGDRLWNK